MDNFSSFWPLLLLILQDKQPAKRCAEDTDCPKIYDLQGVIHKLRGQIYGCGFNPPPTFLVTFNK